MLEAEGMLAEVAVPMVAEAITNYSRSLKSPSGKSGWAFRIYTSDFLQAATAVTYHNSFWLPVLNN
jgi:hypothetical protein